RPEAEAVVETQLGDAVHVAQRFLELEVGVVLESTLERGDDLRLGEAVAARSANGEDERKAEFLEIGGVETAQRVELGGAAMGQAGAPLFVGRRCRERRGAGTTGQRRMRAQQGEAAIAVGAGDGLEEDALE